MDTQRAQETPHGERAIRKQKLAKLASVQSTPYPNQFRRTHTFLELREKAPSFLEAASPPLLKAAGRIRALRHMGKLTFLRVEDGSGSLQWLLSPEDFGQEESVYRFWVAQLDVGDLIGGEGRLATTKRGELTLRCSKVEMLSKALLPLPEKYHGLTDPELRHRKRYLDLIMNPEVRQRFYLRSRLTTAIRDYLTQEGFLEVETPMMHPIPGGATARPFKTYHNALGEARYLRIAPELYLKRLVVGGFEKVFELNRNFRNEGVSTRHNPEFTMLEFYEAYVGYQEQMERVEALLRFVAQRLFGTLQLPDGTDLSQPFQRLSMRSALEQRWPERPSSSWDSLEDLKAHVTQQTGISFPESERPDPGHLYLLLFEKFVEPTLITPTFITDYPSSVSPLAKRKEGAPGVAERFEFFVHGRELANGFSELNDPEEQAKTFMAQAKEREAGDEEAMYYDAEYVEALEYGLPPTGGTGIGIDRWTMWFTQAESIRDVILFPTLRGK